MTKNAENVITDYVILGSLFKSDKNLLTTSFRYLLAKKKLGWYKYCAFYCHFKSTWNIDLI